MKAHRHQTVEPSASSTRASVRNQQHCRFLSLGLHKQKRRCCKLQGCKSPHDIQQGCQQHDCSSSSDTVNTWPAPGLLRALRLGAILLPALATPFLIPRHAVATAPPQVDVASSQQIITVEQGSRQEAVGPGEVRIITTAQRVWRDDPSLMVTGIAGAVVLMMLLAKAVQVLQQNKKKGENDNENDISAPFNTEAVEQWKQVPEEWWKTDATKDDPEWWNRDREELVVSANGNGAPSSSVRDEGEGSNGSLSFSSTLGAEQWQNVKEEWWKREDLRDDPNWWEKDRDELLPESSDSSVPSPSVASSSSWREGAQEPVLPTMLNKAQREVKFVWDTVRYQIIGLGSILTRRDFAPPKEARGTGREFAKPCEYVVNEEKCTAEQKDFLLRKKLAELGEGPVMPDSCYCDVCGGTGTLMCWHCNGSGRNEKGVEEIMGNEMKNIIPRNGVMEVRWMLMKGGPCFLCQGKLEVGCPSCEATGFAGGITKKYVAD